ncbi:hypothetical protein L0664_04935 [Octadecabacter sp. G9-8]|uniref:Uncharacterized protein n=1 Tax=Octadecabacter dasysiphoniae TaxID=2909341 RepID=A0ABS9CVH6_9RHOB|nr:hypothetical protein [Octadecabacter dasysiphoniae]
MKDDVLIQVNWGLNTVRLNNASEVSDGPKWTTLTYSSPATKFEIGANGAKDIVSWNASYTNVFQFSMLNSAAPLQYEVVISSGGLDYYFFILGDTLVGQNQAGHGGGITIDKVGIKKVSLQ